MALLYTNSRRTLEDSEAVVRPVDEEDGKYCVAITFNDGEGEDSVSEVLLTKAEVMEAADLVFNK